MAYINSISDEKFKLVDDGDVTKKLDFELSGITTGNTRSLTIPDRDITLDTITPTTSTTLTTGSVIFSDGSVITQDNSNLFWDNATKTLRLGTVTNNTTIGPTGISYSGTAKPTRSIIILPWEFDLTLGTPAGRGALAGTPALLFDDTTQEQAIVALPIPADFDNTVNPTIKLHCGPVANQTVGSSFVFETQLRYIADGEALNKAIDETLTSTKAVSNSQFIIAHSTFTLNGSLMQPADHLSIVLSRLPGDVSDDRNGDGFVAILEFEYTVTN